MLIATLDLARNTDQIQTTNDAVVNLDEVEIVKDSTHDSDKIQLVEVSKEMEPTHFQVVKNIIVIKARYTTTPVACRSGGV